MPQLSLHSPVGELTVSEEEGYIVSLDWGRGRDQAETPLLLKARAELDEYFAGKRKRFSLPVKASGTPHMEKIWALMNEIPYGKTMTYKDLAEKAKSHPRAVGQACGRNPVPIIIPCHRVLSAHKGLGGYSGGDGPETKAALLRLEGVIFAL